MRMICYGSSSKGNGYLLEGKNETLLIEAGLPISRIRRAVPDWTKVVGCLISHRHSDHTKGMADVLKSGIDVYANEDVWNWYKDKDINANKKMLEAEYTREIGEFKVLPLNANHDVPCFSFLIYHPEMGKLLFVTDSAGCDYSFEGVNHIMIECNYSEPCLMQAIEEGRTKQFVADRTRETHFSIEGLIKFLATPHLLDDVKEVILLHLSHENSDPSQFPLTVEKSCARPTYVAAEGLELDFTI